jgi:DNA-binding MarR family transcriptional regulator
MHDTGRVLVSLMHAAGTVQAHSDARLAPLGLSMAKLAALSALRQAGDSLSLTQLAERLSCVKSNITQLVDRLEADGFVRRAAAPNDRRARLAAVTPAGRLACDEGLRIQALTERELLAGFSATEKRQLVALVEKLEQRAT